MKIGIDISQLAYPQTGVANYLKKLVENLLKIDRENEYVFFGSSLRRKDALVNIAKYFDYSNLPAGKAGNRSKLKIFPFPPTFLDLLWNRLHIIPVEWFIGDVDVFISSDWTQPPTKKAKSITVLYDLLVYKYPQEMHPKIVATQKRRLKWVKKECDQIICISESAKKDAMEVLDIDEKRLKVVYPGR